MVKTIQIVSESLRFAQVGKLVDVWVRSKGEEPDDHYLIPGALVTGMGTDDPNPNLVHLIVSRVESQALTAFSTDNFEFHLVPVEK